MSFKDIIKASVLNNFGSDISLRRIAIVLTVALVLGLYVFLVYRLAVNNEFYSKDFNRSLVLMALATAGIVLAVQSNLVISLGMVGALSIVRYRTAIKSSMDLVFLFWSISIGIICGAGMYFLAMAVCAGMTVAILITEKLENPIALCLLVIHCDCLETADGVLKNIKDYTSFARLKNKTVTKSGTEVIVEYKSKNDDGLQRYLKEHEKIDSFSIMNYDRETRI